MDGKTSLVRASCNVASREARGSTDSSYQTSRDESVPCGLDEQRSFQEGAWLPFAATQAMSYTCSHARAHSSLWSPRHGPAIIPLKRGARATQTRNCPMRDAHDIDGRQQVSPTPHAVPRMWHGFAQSAELCPTGRRRTHLNKQRHVSNRQSAGVMAWPSRSCGGDQSMEGPPRMVWSQPASNQSPRAAPKTGRCSVFRRCPQPTPPQWWT